MASLSAWTFPENPFSTHKRSQAPPDMHGEIAPPLAEAHRTVWSILLSSQTWHATVQARLRLFVTIISKGLFREILESGFPAECSATETEGGTKLHQPVITETVSPWVYASGYIVLIILLQLLWKKQRVVLCLFVFKVNHHWWNKQSCNGLLQLICLFSKHS